MQRILCQLAVLSLLVGVGLWIVANEMPAFSDQQLADEIFWGPSPNLHGREAYDAFARNWHDRMNELRTAKYVLRDLGSVFLAGALTILVSLLAFKQDNSFDWQTPPKRWIYLVLWLVFVALIGIEFYLDIVKALERWEVPPWADSAAIPLAALAFLLTLLVPAAFVLSLAHVGFMQLPARMGVWRPHRPAYSITVTILYGAIAVFWLGVGVLAAVEGLAVLFLACLLATYLSISTRAGLIEHLKPYQQPS
ncbi:hypothetical protein [Hyphobacterium sp.]|uniref:hypothetical protein n=1 Tax=Hyphobacterium sp. TaxID=2004662 RepID=UPI00374A29AB